MKNNEVTTEYITSLLTTKIQINERSIIHELDILESIDLIEVKKIMLTNILNNEIITTFKSKFGDINSNFNFHEISNWRLRTSNWAEESGELLFEEDDRNIQFTLSQAMASAGLQTDTLLLLELYHIISLCWTNMT